MKRLFLLLLSLFLLTGCRAHDPQTSIPETTIPPTEPPTPWIQELGIPWDAEGALTELPLTIPDGLHYNNALEFAGDLLLWAIDDHREEIRTTELCLVELDTGKVSAQVELDFEEFVNPQILGDQLFLCDNRSGVILELDHTLQVTNRWNTDPVEGNLQMGTGGKLYIYHWDGGISVRDLDTGEERPLLEEGTHVDYFSSAGQTVSIDYYDPVTGEKKTVLLDLSTGLVMEPAIDSNFSALYWQDGTWLCETYRDGYVFYIGDASGSFRRTDRGYSSIKLVDSNTLLHTLDDGCHISLHDVTGKSISQVKLTATPFSQSCTVLIPSEAFGGYFLLVGDYGTSQRLLYWDPAKGMPGEDIVFESVPEPEEAEALIRERVEKIKETYGLNILVGTDCETSFYDFSAEPVTDWEQVREALDTMENALKNYPDGFFRQLRYDTIHSIEINLMGTITATNSEYVDTYEAFVQEEYDRHVMVVDMFLAREQTYYHEFSHIIDAFLTWDSFNREDSLFSEDAWNSLNPDWFPGYTWDYSRQQPVEDYSCFVDTYSTIKPTEDRARVLEYAMADYGCWTFEDAPVLLSKLDYYCLCIRDAFDTSGWPDTVLWEQYLP